MTVPATTQGRAAYYGDGTTKEFVIPFLFYNNSDGTAGLRVSTSDLDGGNPTVLTYETDYTLTNEGEPAGTLTLTQPLPANRRIVVVYDLAFEQETSLSDFSRMPAQLIEKAMNRLTLELIQLREIVDRCVKESVESTTDPNVVIEKINVLYLHLGEMQTIATDIANIDTVANDKSAIDALAAITGVLNTLNTNILALKTNAANITAINDVAGMDEELLALHEKLTDLVTLHAKLSELLAVYAKLTAVQTVADNVADVTLAALEMGAIKDAPNQAALAAARAESARVYAEGTDAEVAALGGVRSAKEWSKSVSTFARPGETVRIPVEANYYLPAGCVKKDGSVYAANGVFKDFYDNYLKVLSGQTHFSTECLNNYPSSLDTTTGMCEIATGNTADVIEFKTAVSLRTATVGVKVTISGVADSTFPYILFVGTCRSNWSSRGPYLALVKDDDGNPYLATFAPSKTPSFANASATVALSEFLASPTLYDGTYEITLKLAANNTDVEFHVYKSGYETVVTDPNSNSPDVKRVYSRSSTSVFGGNGPTTNGVTIDLTSLTITENGVVSYPCVAEITIPRLQTCTFAEYAAEIEASGVCEKFGVSDTQFKVPTAADGSNELVVLSTGAVMRSALDWSEWMTEATSMKADIAKKQDLSANFLTNSATSGTVNLTADKVYRHMVTGAVTYVLPTVTTNDTCHQIRIMLSMAAAQTINWGTTHYVNGVSPDVSKAGSYEVLYTQQGNAWWWVGVIYLGG